MRVGVPDKVGAGATTRVTFTMKVPDPILKVTVPVYVPEGSCALRFEAEIVTLVEAPAFKVLAVGLTKSHFVPSDANRATVSDCYCLCCRVAYIGNATILERI